MDLSTFLIQRACEKPIIANYLYWYARVECENNNSAKDKPISDMYQDFVKRLLETLETVRKSFYINFNLLNFDRKMNKQNKNV